MPISQTIVLKKTLTKRDILSLIGITKKDNYKFTSINICKVFDGSTRSIDAKSLLGLLSICLSKDDEIEIRTNGDHAGPAGEEIKKLFIEDIMRVD